MFFLLKVGDGNLYHKNSSLNSILGIVEAASKKRAAKKLNLVKWDGWRHGGSTESRSLARLVDWEDYFFLLKDIGKIKNNFFGSNTSGVFVRLFSLEPIKNLNKIK